jgi:hypothetical protein
VISLFAVIGTSLGTSPFFKASVNESLLYLQAFLSVVTTTALVLAGVLAERHRAELSTPVHKFGNAYTTLCAHGISENPKTSPYL